MKKISLSIAAAVSIAASSAAFAAERPTYEVNGFPVSPVQVGLLGAKNVQEQPAASAAPLHQASILMPQRKLKTATAAPITTGAGH
ncbi:hypothetical protein [Bradyrhizobium sp. STM 3562]|uniref:hypothetical protein n=1 Tax=Bradyrhizobium sp. STM 3562 TaxID=578924 RepID=UPI0038908902